MSSTFHTLHHFDGLQRLVASGLFIRASRRLQQSFPRLHQSFPSFSSTLASSSPDLDVVFTKASRCVLPKPHVVLQGFKVLGKVRPSSTIHSSNSHPLYVSRCESFCHAHTLIFTPQFLGSTIPTFPPWMLSCHGLIRVHVGGRAMMFTEAQGYTIYQCKALFAGRSF